MKNFIIAILGLILIFSCEDVIDVNLAEGTPRLVIDASVERQFDKDGTFVKDAAFVNLSLSTPFFSEAESFVNMATVTLIDLEANIGYNFNNFDGQGNYEIFDNNFSLKNNVDYKLVVQYNGESYESIVQMKPSTPFTEIKQIKNDSGFDDDSIAVEIAFKDLEGQEDFYFLDLGDANVTSIDGKFFKDGEEIRITYFFEDSATLDHLFRIYGSNKRFNSFVDALNELSGGDSNGPFGTVPFKARGNIVNTTNSENFPFGFFRVSEVYSWPIQLVPNKDFVPPVKPETN